MLEPPFRRADASPHKPDISIILVNWRSCAYLRDCLASIYGNDGGTLKIETIVVDNASYDGAKEMIDESFPRVIYVQSEKNLGFSGANNLGYRYSLADVLLFLNPDTKVLGRAMDILHNTLESIPEAGIAGARLLNSDMSLQTSCVQAFPSILNQIFDAEILRRWFPKADLWGNGALFEEGTTAVVVEVISGACLMIKRNVFETVQGFSEDYFMYSEDVDLSFKAVDAGWKNYYCPQATVVHYGGASSENAEKNSFAAIMMRESLRRFFVIRRSRLYAAAYRCTTGLVALCRILLMAVLLPLRRAGSSRQENSGSLTKWLRIFRWSIGLEGWAAKQTVE